jgi:hypothetical protein
VLFYKNNRKHFPMFTSSYANTRVSLEEREMCVIISQYLFKGIPSF